MRNERLVSWLSEHVGSSRRWASGRMLALDSGVSHTTVNTVLEGGRVKADTLIQLARTVGDNPVGVLVAAGLLSPEEVAEERLDRSELAWLGLYRRMSGAQRGLVQSVAEGLLGQYPRRALRPLAEVQRLGEGPG